MPVRRTLIAGYAKAGLPALFFIAAPAAWAGRPLVTDDAPILDPGQCQLETWTQRDPAHTHYWAVPSCNVNGNWEMGGGVARLQGHGGDSGLTLAVIQAKALLAKADDGSWLLGVAGANQFEPSRGLAGDLTLYFPLTVNLFGDRLQWHTNLGWRRERHGRPGATWAMALEAALNERVALTVESYGVRNGGAWRQIGARYTLLPGRADIDVACGEKAGQGNRERYYAAGLTVYANLP